MSDVAKWCILRTAGQRTLPLMRSLNDAGIAAWTPTAFVTRRLSRRSKRISYEAPFTPTFVFAPLDDVMTLRRTMVVTPAAHPPFSIMKIDGEAATVRDAELDRLRAAEERSRIAARRRELTEGKVQAEPYRSGDEVRLSKGAFTGLAATVESSDRRNTWLVFSPSFRMKVETFQLRDDAVTV